MSARDGWYIRRDYPRNWIRVYHWVDFPDGNYLREQPALCGEIDFWYPQFGITIGDRHCTVCYEKMNEEYDVPRLSV